MIGYEYSDLQKFATKNDLKIENDILIFDGDTKDLEYINLERFYTKDEDAGNRVDIEIKVVEFRTEQPKLKYLDLGAQEIERIIIKNCPSLIAVQLHGCGLKEIKFEGVFPELQLIDVSTNKLTELDLPINNFPKLQYLFFERNKIKDLSFLSPFILDEARDFDFGFDDNPIETPPKDIVGDDNYKLIEWIKAEKAKLNEIKIILIGDGEAGKTSLLKRLKYNSFDENELQTDGINIEEIDFGDTKSQFSQFEQLKDLHGYFWDFGGQEIMSATHTFFLTKRTIYILLIEARKDSQINDQLNKWIRRIAAYAEDVPVIVVANKIDKTPNFTFVNIDDIKKEFPQIKDFVAISCKDNTNIENLKEIIADLIPKTGYFNTWVDIRWLELKKKIKEQLKGVDYFLRERDFREICNKVGLKKKQQQTDAVKFLHNLGIVIYFEDIATAEYYILDPYWVTYGVYRIITSEKVGKNKGKVYNIELDYIVNEEKEKTEEYKHPSYRKIEYDKTERMYLVDILYKFKLAYRLPDNNGFIIPDRLEGNPSPQVLDEFVNAENKNFLQMVFEYKFIPPTIMPQIIVDIQKFYSLREVWKTGFVIENGGNSVFVNNYKNRIFIKIKGKQTVERRNLMINIIAVIETINKRINTKADKLIPLPELENEFVKYEKLIIRKNKNKKYYIYHEDEEDEQSFLISELLDGMPEQSEIEKRLEVIERKIDDGRNEIRSIDNKLETLLIEIQSNVKNKMNADEKEFYEQLITEMNSINIKTQQIIFDEILKYIDNSEKNILNKIDEKYIKGFRDSKNSGVKMNYSLSLLKLLDLSGVPVGSLLDTILNASGISLSVDFKKLWNKIFSKNS